MTIFDFMYFLGFVFLALAEILRDVVNWKDTQYKKRRLWMRLRVAPVVFAILAVGTQLTVGRIETRTKQEEANEQLALTARIAAKIEILVAQGKLSREDARRLLVKM
jgi:hypothetical protein